MAGAFDTVDIGDIDQGRLWVIYGRSNTGKDVTASTFPKPLLYIPIGDDGRESIKDVKGIDTLPDAVSSIAELKKLARKALKDKHYKTIVVSTFSLLTNEWKDEKIIQAKKRMTQQSWGDLMNDTEEVIRLFARAAKTHEVVLICHEAMDDQIEDMEDEITPNIRPSITRGARVYLEGVANYGIHCAKFKKDVETDTGSRTVVKYGAHVGPNPYYWTKVQTSPKNKVPARIINPSYKKILEALNK